MDKLVRKVEVPLAQKAISDAGLYIARPEDADRLAEIAMDAYREYPLHIFRPHTCTYGLPMAAMTRRHRKKS